MKQLKEILYKVPLELVKGKTDISVSNIHFDSRKVEQGDVFVAIDGALSDGHEYIDMAIKNGAVAVVLQHWPEKNISEEITCLQVKSTKKALAFMAANFYDNPSRNLKLVGVTGTNGKTTVSTLLYKLFTLAGFNVGLISTVTIKIGEREYPTKLTTPDSLTINKYLKMMNDQGVEYCFMEASSHGIDQKRTAGLMFEGGIFTNLSQDHLDYHKDFSTYRDVKKSFFDQLPKSAFALTNKDDKNGAFMLQNTVAKSKTYGLKSMADYKAKVLEDSFDGMLITINGKEVWTKLIGTFNAYNLLAIYGAAESLGLEPDEILKYISELQAVEGRFEYFISPKEKITAIVDYAHTPDALKNVLATINTIRTRNETLFTVVGCGGDRDRDKRPKMGRIAAELSDQILITSDNPRTEDPDRIIAEVEAGVQPQDAQKVLSITDRKQAIKTACKMAGTKDIILIAGKGHETYQEVNGERHHFDDMELVTAFLTDLKK